LIAIVVSSAGILYEDVMISITLRTAMKLRGGKRASKNPSLWQMVKE
jgi:hypothetical protein